MSSVLWFLCWTIERLCEDGTISEQQMWDGCSWNMFGPSLHYLRSGAVHLMRIQIVVTHCKAARIVFCASIYAFICYIKHNVGKCTFWHVRPMKTQISPRIRAVWSYLSIWTNFASLAIQNAPSEDSDLTAQSDLTLRWAHMSEGKFSHAPAH